MRRCCCQRARPRGDAAHLAKERNEEVLLSTGPSETATRYWPTMPLRPFFPCHAPMMSASTCGPRGRTLVLVTRDKLLPNRPP